MENLRKIIPIYNQRLCGYLMLNGFVLIDIAPNTDHTGKNVFYFNDTNELRSKMKEFLNTK
jgi:hypothetical protein